MLELTSAHPGSTLIADKGLWGREYHETLALQDVALSRPRECAAATTWQARDGWPACGS